jgi:peroxiredoxin
MEIHCKRILPKRVAYILFLLTLSIPALSAPPAAVPRKSPDFTIYEPSGKVTQLSSLRGKVVVIEFLFLRSQHCMDVIQTLNKLNQELGPRGLQPIAIAFNKGDSGTLVNRMEQYFKLTFPVGYTSAESVDAFFGRTGNERLNIPQIVVIDRTGMIRAQNGAKYDQNLENAASLRAFLDALLKENGPARSASEKTNSSAKKDGL